MRAPLLAIILLFVAAPTLAYRAEFFFERNGRRLVGSEACFHKLYDADHPLGRFFYYPDVVCLPADSVLDVPPGSWDVYMRHPEGFISAHATTLIYEGKPLPDQLYKEIHVTAYPAAYLDLSSVRKKPPEGRRIVVYLPTTHTTYPVANDTSEVMVPAGFPAVALLVENNKPVGMAVPLTLQAGQRAAASEWLPADGRMTVLTWVHIPPAQAKQLSERTDVAVPLATYVAANGATFKPLFPPARAGQFSERLLIFADVPRGPGTLRVEGRKWVTNEVPITPHPKLSVVLPSKPLRTEPSADLWVRWAIPQSSAARCGDEESDAAQTSGREVMLFRCDAAMQTPPEDTKTRCDMIRMDKLPPETSTGELRFEGIAPGPYRLVLDVEGIALATTDVVATALSVVRAEVEASPFLVSGSVTRGDAPLGGRLRFQTGSAIVDKATGRYTALLRRSPGRSPVQLTDCSGEPLTVVIPSHHLEHQQSFDIILSGSNVEVEIVDGRQTPVPGATIHYRVFGSRDRSILAHSPAATSDDSGTALFRDVPARQELQVCASVLQRTSACSETFELRAGSSKRLRLALPDGRESEGRVELPDPIAGGILYWALPDGAEITQTRVMSDGSFIVTTEIPAQAQAFLVARGMPLMKLTVVREDGKLRMLGPNGRDRSFAVSAPANERTPPTYFFRVVIGGATIPGPALTYHQFNHRAQASLRGGERLVVAPIRSNEPLAVRFISSDAIAVLPGIRPSDVFLRPDLRHFVGEQQVPANDQVILPMKPR